MLITGTAGNDSLVGSVNADLLQGLDGNDTLSGGAGSDTLEGGAGIDILFGDDLDNYGTEGDDSLSGGDGADFLSGGGGADTLLGGAGDDYLFGGLADNVSVYEYSGSISFGFGAHSGSDGGDDVLDGGDGNDRGQLFYAERTAPIVFSIADSQTLTGVFVGGVLSGSVIRVENIGIYSGLGSDSLTGGAGADSLEGGGGSDTLLGGAGNDFLLDFASVAADLQYGGADDRLYGDKGDDSINVFRSGTIAATQVLLDGGAGDDYLRFVGGGRYLDSITLDGGDGADNLNAEGAGAATVLAGAGDDRISVDARGGAYDITLGTGVDTLILNYGATPTTVTRAIVVADYATGVSGDKLDLTDYLASALVGSTAGTNLFAAGYLQLVQVGADSVLRVDLDGSGTSFGLTDLVTFKNTVASTFVNANLGNLQTVGTAGNDSLVGSINADLLQGLDGNDTLVGDAGSDTLEGGAGIDILLGDARDFNAAGGSDSLSGGDGADFLAGGRGADTLIGGAGDDYLLGGVADNISVYEFGTRVGFNFGSSSVIDGGDDILDGGDGFDQANLVYADRTGAISLSIADPDALNAITVGGVLAGSVTHVEVLSFYGGRGNDTLVGGASYDFLNGNGGDDSLVGGAGYDSLYGNDGADSLIGGNDGDFLVGGAGNDLLLGEAGNDYLHVAVGLDTANGGEGDDVIQYGYGFAGDLPTETDTVADGGSGIDTLEFGMVTAALTVNLSVKSSFQSIGFGRLNQVGIENISGGTASDTFTGDSLANVLAGREGADTLSGGAGDDTLLGGLGDDSLDGGGGIDTASYAGASAGVTVCLALTTAQNTGGDGIDTLRSIEVLFGSTFADSLTGAATNDSLNGGGGADTLDGGAGRDTLVGGSGNDLYRLDSSLDVIVESFGAGTDTAIVTGSYTLGTGVSIERLEAVAGTTALNLTGNEYAQVLVGNAGINTLDGKAGADTMIGGAGNDTYLADSAADVITELAGEGLDLVRTTAPIYQLGANLENLTYTGASAFKGTGNALNNVITGGIGVDQLDGGAGADRLIGLAGNDTYIVDNLADVVVEAVGEGLDTVKTAIAAFVLGANVENLTYTGLGNFQGFGNILANVITGGAGNDTLDGKAGADRLVGGLGDDTYFTDSVSDTVVELAGQGQDRILTTLNSAKAADNVETLQYIGTGNFQGYANATGTSIFGSTGNDTLVGGAGSDLLAGQGGNDQLTGGGGADLFYFDSPLASQGVDRITDFVSGVDHIQLRASTFGVTTIADLGFVAGVAPVAADTRPTLLYDTATGALWFDATGGDNSDQVQIAFLTGRPALTLGDVFVV